MAQKIEYINGPIKFWKKKFPKKETKIIGFNFHNWFKKLNI